MAENPQGQNQQQDRDKTAADRRVQRALDKNQGAKIRTEQQKNVELDKNKDKDGKDKDGRDR